MAAGASGDIDGDGALDIVIGQYHNDDSGIDAGAIYVINLHPCPRPIDGSPRVFAIPDGTGVEKCLPASTQNPPVTLPLYLGTAPNVSTAGTLCALEPNGGDGDELCAYDIRIQLSGDLTIDDFTPALPFEQQTNEAGGFYPAQELRVNWLDPSNPTDPTQSPFHVGDLVVNAPTTIGSIEVAAGSMAVGASAQAIAIPRDRISVPEPGQLSLLGAGILGLLVLVRRRARTGLLGLMLYSALGFAGLGASEATALQQSVAYSAQIGSGLPGMPRGTGQPFWYDETVFVDAVVVGDVDNNGVEDLAASSFATASCQCRRIHILFMDKKGTRIEVMGSQAVTGEAFGGGDLLGVSMAAVGDLNDDGVPDLAVSAAAAGSVGEGELRIIYLDRLGNAISVVTIDDTDLSATLEAGDRFGLGIAPLGDIDGDGIDDLVAGAWGDDDLGSDAGAVYVLLLDANEQVTHDFKITTLGTGNAGSPTLAANDHFGFAVTGVGDLDGNGTVDIAVGADGDDNGDPNSERGAVWILFLDYDPVGPTLNVLGHTKIGLNVGGFTASSPFNGDPFMRFGSDLRWLRSASERGGELAVYAHRAGATNYPGTYLLTLGPDGFVRRDYAINGFTAPTIGFSVNATSSDFGRATVVLPDWNGDETPDLMITESWGFGRGYILYMLDSDHDGLDDNLDNCPFEHNPAQTDADGDGIGDLCDNCVDDANTDQLDGDANGVGDICEPVQLQLQPTGTSGAPSWDFRIACGAYDVTELHVGIVPPSGVGLLTADFGPGCTSTDCSSATGLGASVSALSSNVLGPQLASPQRGDALYVNLHGAAATSGKLCNAGDPPTVLASMVSGPVSGGQLTAAALTSEGVGAPGYGFALASDSMGAIPIQDIQLKLVPPVPAVDIELGPAVNTGTCSGGSNPGAACADDSSCTGGTCSLGTRWEVCITSNEQFHRASFGLIAPAGTTTNEMRWVGCDTAPGTNAERACVGGGGYDNLVYSADSFTVGPTSAPPNTLLPDTLYVVAEGNAFAGIGVDRRLNSPGLKSCIGAVELDASPDLEPALTLDGVNDIPDWLDLEVGPIVTRPLQKPGDPNPFPVDEVQLIGEFDPADDLDGDSVQDLADNCPFIANAAQLNRGSFLNADDESDAWGDACQCADATGDGAVLDPDDLQEIRDYLSGQITNPVLAADIAARCSVAGTTECNMRDLVVLQVAIDNASPEVENRCDAALSPATHP